MATIKTINEKFRRNLYDEAFQEAYNDWQQDSDNVWEQRKMGWAYTYMLKYDTTQNDWKAWKQHFNGFFSLNQLSYNYDSAIFDSLLWRIISVPFSEELFEVIFSNISNISFNPSNAYSAFLKRMLKCKEWSHLMEFIEWWDLSKMQSDDYSPYEFTDEKGKTKRMMPLAEQAYIAYAKMLLAEHNTQKIRTFIPKIEILNDTYPTMVYPGYFCGKLLLALDAENTQTIKRLLPFIQRKSRDFWAWQLLSEVFDEDSDKQIACLYRAISCCPKEDFLVKVRSKLAQLLIKRGDFARTKFHVDIVVQTRTNNHWGIPRDLRELTCQDWYKSTIPDKSSPLDYLKISNEIAGLKNAMPKHEQQENKREIEGKVTANKANTALFLSNKDTYAFIPPALAEKVKVGDRAKATVIDAMDTKRNKMGLRCISIETFFNNPSAASYIQNPPAVNDDGNEIISYDFDDELPF